MSKPILNYPESIRLQEQIRATRPTWFTVSSSDFARSIKWSKSYINPINKAIKHELQRIQLR